MCWVDGYKVTDFRAAEHGKTMDEQEKGDEDE